MIFRHYRDSLRFSTIYANIKIKVKLPAMKKIMKFEHFLCKTFGWFANSHNL